MGGMRTEVMRGDPTDDRPRKIGGYTRRHVDDGRARLEAVRGGPVDDRRARLEAVHGGSVDDGPRAVGGYARLELMHGFEIWGVGGPSFPQVEASTKWSL